MSATDPKARFGDRLRRARMLRGFSLRALSEALGGRVSHAALQKYEKGLMGPDSPVLNALCDVLQLRPDFFFQAREVELAGIEFRKRKKLTKKDEDRAREEAREFFERYLEVEEILEFESPELEQVNLSGDAVEALPDWVEKAAMNLRKKWKLGLNAIPNVHELLEDNGVKVKEIDCPDALDGFSGRAGGVPVVVLAKWLNKDRPRKRFTATHELAHLHLKLPDGLAEKTIEACCNRFAGEFLIPKERFEEAFGGERSRVSLGELIAIKEEWGISIAGIMWRAKDLGLVTDRHYLSFVKFSRSRGWHKPGAEPGNWKGTEDAFRFKHLVCQAASKELITRSKAAGLLGKSLREIEEDLMLV